MREILYRGKRVDAGEWVEGYIVKATGSINRGCCYISPKVISVYYSTDYHDFTLGGFIEVDPETVCEFTGLSDKNGKKIFEGDIVECWSQGLKACGEVQHRIDGLWIIYPAWQKQIMWGLCPNTKGNTDVEVIGSIFDNPELLGEDKQ